LPLGRDCLTWVYFDPEIKTEWCLLHQADNIYNFVTAETIDRHLDNNIRHPMLSRDLVGGDILRGQAVLDLLHGQKIFIDELTPGPGFLSRLVNCQLTSEDRSRIGG
jgi:hypothetical protein